MSMEAFFTREKANSGIKVPLSLPNGEVSDHYLMIRGVDSDSFRDADTKARRNAAIVVDMETDEEKDSFLEDSRLDILASLLISWSFEEECNPENIKKLFKEAPQIADAVDKVAAKRSLFFGKESSSLLSTQK